MQAQPDEAQVNSDLIIHRALWVATALTLAAATVALIWHGEQWQLHWPEDQLISLRTILYALAILAFPLTNLIRHIQIRLCQTMPGDAPPKRRYLTTVIVSLTLVESIGIMGLILFLLGDGYNTLSIFSGLSALGFVLYRPKTSEYLGIVQALARQDHG